MKRLFLLLFLTLSLTAQGQIFQAKGTMVKDIKRAVDKALDTLKKNINTEVSLQDSMWLQLGNKAKNIANDTLTPRSEILEQLSKKTDSTILLKGKSLLQRNVIVQVPSKDSISLKQLGTKAQVLTEDTLKSTIEPFMGSNALQRLTDSSILDEAKSISKIALEDSLNKYLPDITLDSTIIDQVKVGTEVRAKGALNKEGTPDITIDSTLNDQIRAEGQTKARTALEDEAGTDIPDITIDSTTATQLKKEVVRRAENTVKGREEFTSIKGLKKSPEIDKLKGEGDKLEQKQAELAQAASKQEIKEKLASHARQYMTKHAEKIQELHSKIGKLKRKYATMPNSNDLSSAVKRTSLKGEPFWKRLVIGGNFNIGRTKQFAIDLSPVVGYKANKLFELGAIAVYRTQINADKKGISIRNGNVYVYGYGLFASHMVFGSFFGYLEGERMTTTNLNPENRQREWKELLLAGIGKKFNVSKWLEMQTMVLVNVLHDNRDGLYNSPVVFKTAVRLR